MTPGAVARAARVADGFVFGTAGSAAMKEAAPRIREAFAKEGKETSPSPASRTSRSATTRRQRSTRAPTTSCATTDSCGRSRQPDPPRPAAKIAEEIAAYDGAVDVLIVFPQIPSLDQVEQLAEHVLPAYRTEAVAVR